MNRGNKFVRNGSAFDRIDKFKSLSSCFGLNPDHRVSVLTASSGLADILSFAISQLLDRFLVRDLGCSYICFYLKLPAHTVDENFQMQLSHTPDDGLVGFQIAFNLKCRIFLGQALRSE